MKLKLIYYSLLTIVLAGLGVLLRPSEAAHFLEDWVLWYEPVLAGLICGLLSALLGVYMLMNRIVFISLAISQGAGVGIFAAYAFAGLAGVSLGDSPWALGAGFSAAMLTAALFSLGRKSRHATDESLIGLIYAGASGLILLIGDRISEGRHDIDNLLFGNAVAVTGGQLSILAAVALLVGAIHFIFRRKLLYVSADPSFLATRGVAVRRWRLLLFSTLTLGITIALRTLGVLPTFALMVIPPWLALRASLGLRETFALSLFLGIVIPPMGYFASFLFALPTGAAMIGMGILYALSGIFLESVLRILSKPSRMFSTEVA